MTDHAKELADALRAVIIMDEESSNSTWLDSEGRAVLAAYEASLTSPSIVPPAMPPLAAVIAHYGIDALCKALAPQIVREAEQPAPWTPPEDRAFGRECATEGCNRPSTVHFVRGGIGSDYCGPCYLRVQAAIAPLPGDAP